VRRVAITGAVLASLLTTAFVLAPAAGADLLVAPQLFIRADGASAWQPLASTLQTGSVGGYDVGVRLQTTSADFNRQAFEVDVVGHPGTSVPSAWSGVAPFTPECDITAGNSGSIQEIATVPFIGNGTYTLGVSIYTEDQHDAFPPTSPQTCSGGPATTGMLTYDAATVPSITGTPLVPRTTREAHGFTGLTFTAPSGNTTDEWRCALNPVRRPDGAVTGAAVLAGFGNQAVHRPVKVPELQAFSRPGKWACSTRAASGDSTFGRDYTPWATTPTVTVKGQYQWNVNGTTIFSAGHGRVRVRVRALRALDQAVARHKLAFVLYRSSCRSGRIVNTRALGLRARIDAHGDATYVFRAPSALGFYVAKVTYPGSSLVLRGASPDPIEFQSTFDPSFGHTFAFTGAYAPCG
jgi:hypothetical protein